MDHHVVADQTHLGAALHIAFGDLTTRHLADLGDVEHLEDLGVAEEGFAHFRCQLARHGGFDVIDEIVDDIVIADFDARPLGRIARLARGPHVEAENNRTRCLRQADIAFVDATHGVVDDPASDFGIADLFQRLHDGFRRTLHVGLDEDRELGDVPLFDLRHHLFE